MDGVHEMILRYWRDLQGKDLSKWWEEVSSQQSFIEFHDTVVCTFAFYAITTGRRDLFNLMLNNNLKPNTDGDDGRPLIFSAIASISDTGFSSIRILKDLIVAGADVNSVCHNQSWTPVFEAISKNALAHLVILLESGADPWKVIGNINSFEYALELKNVGALTILREFS